MIVNIKTFEINDDNEVEEISSDFKHEDKEYQSEIDFKEIIDICNSDRIVGFEYEYLDDVGWSPTKEDDSGAVADILVNYEQYKELEIRIYF